MIDLLWGKFVEGMAQVAGFTIRWYFTEERLSSRVEVYISGEHEGVVIDGGQVPSLRGWIHVTNHNPFPITLTWAVGEVSLAGPLGKFSIPEGFQVQKHSTKQVHFREFMHDWAANRLEEAVRLEQRARIALDMRFSSKMRPFLLQRNIETSNTEIYNVGIKKEN